MFVDASPVVFERPVTPAPPPFLLTLFDQLRVIEIPLGFLRAAEYIGGIHASGSVVAACFLAFLLCRLDRVLFLCLDQVGYDLIYDSPLFRFGHMTESLQRVLQLRLGVRNDQFVQHFRSFLDPREIAVVLRGYDGYGFAIAGLCLYVVMFFKTDISGMYEHIRFGGAGLRGAFDGFGIHLQRLRCIAVGKVDISYRTVDAV